MPKLGQALKTSKPTCLDLGAGWWPQRNKPDTVSSFLPFGSLYWTQVIIFDRKHNFIPRSIYVMSICDVMYMWRSKNNLKKSFLLLLCGFHG